MIFMNNWHGIDYRVRTGRLDFPARGIHILRGQGDMRSLGNPELLVAAMNQVFIISTRHCVATVIMASSHDNDDGWYDR